MSREDSFNRRRSTIRIDALPVGEGTAATSSMLMDRSASTASMRLYSLEHCGIHPVPAPRVAEHVVPLQQLIIAAAVRRPSIHSKQTTFVEYTQQQRTEHLPVRAES